MRLQLHARVARLDVWCQTQVDMRSTNAKILRGWTNKRTCIACSKTAPVHCTTRCRRLPDLGRWQRCCSQGQLLHRSTAGPHAGLLPLDSAREAQNWKVVVSA